MLKLNTIEKKKQNGILVRRPFKYMTENYQLTYLWTHCWSIPPPITPSLFFLTLASFHLLWECSAVTLHGRLDGLCRLRQICHRLERRTQITAFFTCPSGLDVRGLRVLVLADSSVIFALSCFSRLFCRLFRFLFFFRLTQTS